MRTFAKRGCGTPTRPREKTLQSISRRSARRIGCSPEYRKRKNQFLRQISTSSSSNILYRLQTGQRHRYPFIEPHCYQYIASHGAVHSKSTRSMRASYSQEHAASIRLSHVHSVLCRGPAQEQRDNLAAREQTNLKLMLHAPALLTKPKPSNPSQPTPCGDWRGDSDSYLPHPAWLSGSWSGGKGRSTLAFRLPDPRGRTSVRSQSDKACRALPPAKRSY